MSKRLLCRLGIHKPFNDRVGENLGTAETPIIFITTYQTCNYCSWTTRPQK